MTLHTPDETLAEMALSRRGDVAELAFTTSGLARFRDAVAVWQAGGEDFSIHPDDDARKRGLRDGQSGELWFWTPLLDP